jgi:hypothetical protein
MESEDLRKQNKKVEEGNMQKKEEKKQKPAIRPNQHKGVSRVLKASFRKSGY